MAEQTVREQLVEALENLVNDFDQSVITADPMLIEARAALARARAEPEESPRGCRNPGHCQEHGLEEFDGCLGCASAAAVRRHRAEPETHHREDLLLALDGLFECDYRSITDDEWTIAEEAFKAAQSELSCPDLCDTSCRCYQEGLEAQRERVG